MIKVENIYVGTSQDENDAAKLKVTGVRAVLNVAHDLVPTLGWGNGFEYAHVGLIDGPGNSVAAYVAAVLFLKVLMERRKSVLVCCHDGGRSLAVTVMYLSGTTGHSWPGDWGVGWDRWLSLIEERAGVTLPKIHPAHKFAFDKIDWRGVVSILKD